MVISARAAATGRATKDCEKVKIRANFKVKLGLKKERIGSVVDEWKAWFVGGDTVDAGGGWTEIEVCVEAWKAKLYKNAPGTSVKVGNLILTVKPNAQSHTFS